MLKLLPEGISMFKFLQIALLGLCLAGCQTSSLRSSAAQDVSTRLVGINANQWTPENQDSSTSRLTVYGCNPSICPNGAAVSYLVTESSLAQFGSKAILKTFTDARTQLEGEGAILSANHATRLKGFMAFKREYKKDYNGRVKFLSSAMIFTNNTQVVIASASSDAKSARKYRDEFVSKLEIKKQ
jgi:hypothetical protein